ILGFTYEAGTGEKDRPGGKALIRLDVKASMIDRWRKSAAWSEGATDLRSMPEMIPLSRRKNSTRMTGWVGYTRFVVQNAGSAIRSSPSSIDKSSGKPMETD